MEQKRPLRKFGGASESIYEEAISIGRDGDNSEALPAVAAERCSIHPRKGLSDAQLGSLAKLSQADAEKIALDKFHGKGSISIVSAELEAEHRCLIWSFDLRVAGQSGIQEVQVDAGDGKVLSVKHESAKQEAIEASKEKTTRP